MEEKMMEKKTFPIEEYRDLGWLNFGGHWPELEKCKEKGHTMEERDMSLFKNRGTNMVYICKECRIYYHVDMSD
jgi:hypothetical protein